MGRFLPAPQSGPVFVTERKARVQLPAADLDPAGHARLSYQQAEELFSEASGGATLTNSGTLFPRSPTTPRTGPGRAC